MKSSLVVLTVAGTVGAALAALAAATPEGGGRNQFTEIGLALATRPR
jgi:hypothetical protein